MNAPVFSGMVFQCRCWPVFFFFSAAPASLAAQEKEDKGTGAQQQDGSAKPRPSYDLIGWGQLKPVKNNEGFFDFTCTVSEKGRWKKKKVFVKITDDLKVLADRRARLADFKKDDKAFILGKEREDTSLSPMGLSFTDYRIIGVQAVLKGKGIKINKDYRDRRDRKVRWLDTLVETNDGQVKVTYFEQMGYRVEVDKKTILRSRLPADPGPVTANTKGFYAFVLGKNSQLRPQTGRKADEKRAVFSTNRVIVLDLAAVKLGLLPEAVQLSSCSSWFS